MDMDAKPRCKATTKGGQECKAAPLTDTDFCLAHSPAEVREKTGFVADNGKGGRPRRPRMSDLYWEVYEEKREELRKVIDDALEAERAVVVGNGPSAELAMVADHAVRLKALDMVSDRTDGKPRQAVEVSGGETPVVTALVTDPGMAAQARELLRNAAGTSAD